MFSEEPTGLIDQLPALLLRHNFQNIQLYKYPAEFRAETEVGKALFEDHIHLFRTSRPFLQRYGCLPQDYEALCQQAMQDMQQPDFVAKTTYYTFCAVNPSSTRVGPVQRERPS